MLFARPNTPAEREIHDLIRQINADQVQGLEQELFKQRKADYGQTTACPRPEYFIPVGPGRGHCASPQAAQNTHHRHPRY